MSDIDFEEMQAELEATQDALQEERTRRKKYVSAWSQTCNTPSACYPAN